MLNLCQKPVWYQLNHLMKSIRWKKCQLQVHGHQDHSKSVAHLTSAFPTNPYKILTSKSSLNIFFCSASMKYITQCWNLKVQSWKSFLYKLLILVLLHTMKKALTINMFLMHTSNTSKVVWFSTKSHKLDILILLKLFSFSVPDNYSILFTFIYIFHCSFGAS